MSSNGYKLLAKNAEVGLYCSGLSVGLLTTVIVSLSISQEEVCENQRPTVGKAAMEKLI